MASMQQVGYGNVPPPVGHSDGQMQSYHQQQGVGQSGNVPHAGAPGQGQPQHTQAAAAKDFNAAMLCRLGQETVQELVARSLELFQSLRSVQPPDGKMNLGMDRKTKFLETLKNIKTNYKRLRVIYEKIEESFPSNRDIPFEEEILYKSDDIILTFDDKKNTDAYKMAVEEYKEAMEHVIIKNRHLKDAIDHLRTMMWDVNTMLAMRKE